MRLASIFLLLILVGLIYWFGWPQLSGGQGTGGLSAPAATDAADTDVLRIEIVESASQAEAHYQAIVARYQDDARAIAWVNDCLAQSGAENADQAQSWDIGCWRAWDDLQSENAEPD